MQAVVDPTGTNAGGCPTLFQMASEPALQGLIAHTIPTLTFPQGHSGSTSAHKWHFACLHFTKNKVYSI